MSSSDRRTFVAALGGLFALGACGFTPVYGPGGVGQELLGRVEVKAPEDREAYELVKRLEERLGRAGAAPYFLDYTIEVESEDVGLTSAQEISRIRLNGTVAYALTDTATGEVLHSGSVRSFTSYSNLGSTVSTASVERDAYRRLMVILADMVHARLIAALTGTGE